jgi:hypothetical protein
MEKLQIMSNFCYFCKYSVEDEFQNKTTQIYYGD